LAETDMLKHFLPAAARILSSIGTRSYLINANFDAVRKGTASAVPKKAAKNGGFSP
jgi:hypothetical protein